MIELQAAGLILLVPLRHDISNTSLDQDKLERGRETS